MTNIVFWNIQQFGINKVNDPRTRGKRKSSNWGPAKRSPATESAQRRTLINDIFNATQPDIIVIVEVSCGQNGGGDLAPDGGGLQGASFILNYLREQDDDPHALEWRMVPPLIVGRATLIEAVAVIYRGVSEDADGNVVNRYFTGPNVWSGGANGVSQEPGPGVAQLPYAPVGGVDVSAFLVPPLANGAPGISRIIPVGAQYNGNGDGVNTVPENVAAARIHFQSSFDPETWVYYGNFRQPFMTTFVETNAAGVIQRNLTVFAIHAPPQPANSANYMNVSLPDTLVISAPPDEANNEIKIVCGDFNLNALKADGSKSNVYAPLTGLNYAQLLDPADAAPPEDDLSAYKGYFATLIRPPRINKEDSLVPLTQASRFLWSDATAGAEPIPSPYPGYQYIGSDQVANCYSIDNVLVKPHDEEHEYQFTIMNPVVGAPFTLVDPPAEAPTGSEELELSTGFAIAQPPAAMVWPQDPAPDFKTGLARTLNSWPNYGFIRSTSDHLALFFCV